jgi:aspartate carbamoyltransferase catalytic subunit
MHRLGGHVLGFSDAKMTRAGDFYQESIKDTVHMLEYYGDAIVMRHFQQGAPHEAARWSSIPVINGGDGWGEHPTQVLTDLYTVQRELGSVDGKTFLAIGDMRMRTMHSIGYALTQFDAEMIAVAPPELSLTDEFKAELAEQNLVVREVEHVADAIAEADVIYMEPVVQADYTSGRDERGDDVGRTRELPGHARAAHQGTAARDDPALAAPHGRARARRRRDPARAVLAGGVLRGRDAHVPAVPGHGSDGVGARRADRPPWT